jgi:hypothetical protein
MVIMNGAILNERIRRANAAATANGLIPIYLATPDRGPIAHAHTAAAIARGGYIAEHLTVSYSSSLEEYSSAGIVITLDRIR